MRCFGTLSNEAMSTSRREEDAGTALTYTAASENGKASSGAQRSRRFTAGCERRRVTASLHRACSTKEHEFRIVGICRS